MPTGICQNQLSIYDHPVKIARNTSRASNFQTYQSVADALIDILYDLHAAQRIHKQCLDVLVPFLCHWLFSTCDPAFNVSVNQPICQQSCEILVTFVCPEVWRIISDQSQILNFRVVDSPTCDTGRYVNGGDVPDCIDPMDGGE